MNLMRKVNVLGFNSVSLSCLIEEPTTKSERILFINAFLTALKQFIYEDQCRFTRVRLVQEELETI